MLSNRWTFRLRIGAILALLVALNGLFVTALVWAYGTVIPGVVAGGVLLLVEGTASIEFGTLLVSWPTLLALIVAFLVAQVWYGYTRLLGAVWTDAADADGRPELQDAVARLAAMADVPAPDVAVIDAARPNCFTVGHARAATIVVTRPLLEVLDEEELTAVLAHEIAHVANRDVTLMTIAGLFIEIAERAYRAAGLIGRTRDASRTELSARTRVAMDWLFPVLVVSYLFVAPILWLFPIVARLANGALAQHREFAADAGAAAITGAPLALAGALTSLYAYEPPQPAEDLRRAAAGVRALCIVPFGTGPATADWHARDRERPHRTAVGPPSAEGIDVGDDDAAGSDDADAGDGNRIADAGDGDRDADTGHGRPCDGATDRRQSIDEWLDERDPTVSTASTTHPPVEDRIERLIALSSEDR